MKRSELNEAMAKYFADGGKVTKLPDGPDFRFQPYGVRVKPGLGVDLTVAEDPGTTKQRKVVESNSV
jgi:hypothetical protein